MTSPDPAYTAWRDAIAARHQAELDALHARLEIEAAALRVTTEALYTACKENR